MVDLSFSIPDKPGFIQPCLRLLPWIHGLGCVCFAVHPSAYEASTSVASSLWHDERLPADFRLQQKAVFRGILDHLWQCAVDHEPAAPSCAYYCQKEDGSYDVMSPPCNPSIHDEKNWYVFPLFILTAGVQLGVVAGEGLLLEYSQQEPLECRGKMKAEFTMVTMAGSLVSSAAVGIFMNRKGISRHL